MKFGDNVRISSEFGSEPWKICLPGDENGGQEYFATLTRVCVDPVINKIKVITCYSEANAKTPKACDFQWKDVTVNLYCDCEVMNLY
ncbi:MAG: hypothetical protein N2560_06835 [Ignavibacteria bacterium]|nr:hypothetical protein [Ignavibacteria bacterium]